MKPDGMTPVTRSRVNAMGQAAGIGFGIAGALILPIIGGLLIDRWLGKTPLFTLIGVAVGLIAAGYQLVHLGQAAAEVKSEDLGITPEEKARRAAEWELEDRERERERAAREDGE
jgi:F0F1-type ATP synthase assembly protein I